MIEIIVIGILASLGGFALGAKWGMSIKQYVGRITIHETESGGKLYSLELDCEPEELDEKKEVTFKIGSPPSETIEL